MKRRWLYKKDEAQIFQGKAIDTALELGWLKRPSVTVVAEDLDTLDTDILIEKARAMGFKNTKLMKRSTLIKKIKG